MNIKAAFVICCSIITIIIVSTSVSIADFSFARLHYLQRDGAMYPHVFGLKDWNTDYSELGPEITDMPMDTKLVEGIKLLTVIDASAAVVEMTDNIFQYPFIYTVEPEQMDLTSTEALVMREYLLRGGFWMLDDFHGCHELQHVYTQVAKVLGHPPSFYELELSHAVFHTHFSIDEIVQVPVVWLGANCLNGPCITAEAEPPCNEPQLLLEKSAGVLLTYNMDLGDGIEHADTPGYPNRFTVWAYKIFINIILYAMTH